MKTSSLTVTKSGKTFQMLTLIRYSFFPYLITLLDFGDVLCLAICPPPICNYEDTAFQETGWTFFQPLLKLSPFPQIPQILNHSGDTNRGTINFIYIYVPRCVIRIILVLTTMYAFLFHFFILEFNRCIYSKSKLRASHMRSIVIVARYTKLKSKATQNDGDDTN